MIAKVRFLPSLVPHVPSTFLFALLPDVSASPALRLTYFRSCTNYTTLASRRRICNEPRRASASVAGARRPRRGQRSVQTMQMTIRPVPSPVSLMQPRLASSCCRTLELHECRLARLPPSLLNGLVRFASGLRLFILRIPSTRFSPEMCGNSSVFIQRQ